MIARAIFVLTGPEAGGQFLRILPDLRAIGLKEATILHIVAEKRGPAEPMPELATWIRHFESTIPKVELALKRGDAVKWIYELARVRDVDLVVISGAEPSAEWDLERVTSPLRSLGIPILYIPDCQLEASLAERVLVAIKTTAAFERVMPRLVHWFGEAHVEAVRVDGGDTEVAAECAGVALRTVPETEDVATTLALRAEEWSASLVTLVADDEGAAERAREGVPVVAPFLDMTDRPVLIWPIARKPERK